MPMHPQYRPDTASRIRKSDYRRSPRPLPSSSPYGTVLTCAPPLDLSNPHQRRTHGRNKSDRIKERASL